MLERLKTVGESFHRFLEAKPPDRRTSARSEYLRGRCLIVEYVGGTQTVPIVDAHHGGLAVASAKPLPVGGLVTFHGGQRSFSDRVFAKIQGRAKVVYCRSYGEERFLVGLQFQRVTFSPAYVVPQRHGRTRS